MYFVPGGRIGIKRPDEIDVQSNSWTLLSGDHTLMVDVREMIRLGDDHDAHIWAKDTWGPVKQHERIDTDLELPGYEVRRFRSAAYGNDLNYIEETIAVRDATWMGEVVITTGDHGGITRHPGGQVARWLPVIAKVFASIQARPQLPAVDALTELGVSLDPSGLNPRIIGNRLLLSLYVPATPMELWGSNRPLITLEGLSIVWPTATPGEQAAHIDELFAISRKTRGARVVRGSFCRGIQYAELAITGVPDLYSTRILAFSKTRQITIDAMYAAAQRQPILQALQRVFQSLKLTEHA